MARKVRGGKLSSEFRKALYLDHCYLTCSHLSLDITNYEDDNTLHSTNINLNKVLHHLENMTKTLFKWFTDILLKAHPEKSHLLAISAQEIKINMGAMAISNSKCEKLLDIHIDNKLTNQKLNNHINRIHERNLRIVYQDHNSSFDELVAKKGSFKIHDRSLQKLLIEIFKIKPAPEILNEVFDIIDCPYPLTTELRLKSGKIRTVRCGIETALLLAPRYGARFPSELKESTSLNKIRSKIKTWQPENCPYKLCEICLQRIGYLQVTNWYLLIDAVIYVSSFICLFVLLGFFLLVFVFVLLFAPPFSFNLRFKVDLNYPHIPDKGYICSLIYFLFICNFYWSTINK